MKTNLDIKFKMSDTFEKEGIWIEVAEGVRFKVKRFGGFNSQKVRAAMSDYLKPYARKIEMGTLAPEKEQEISVTVFVKSCLTDWQGVKEEVEGQMQEITFSDEKAISLLMQLRGLYDLLLAESSKDENYREVLGND